jgi:integrase
VASIEKRVGIKGTTYTARVRYKGHKYTKTFKSKTKAKKWAERKEKEIDDGMAPMPESLKQTVGDLIDIYDEDKLDESHDGYQKLKNQLEVWREDIGHMKLCEVTPATICKIRRKLQNVKTNRGDRRSNATVNRYMSALSGIFTYAVEELSWLTVNPVTQVKRLPENPPPIRFLDKETELPRLTESCANSSNPRLLPLFMLAICLGLRAFALLWLHRDEVNLEKRTIRIPEKRSKNGRAFTLGISDVLYPHVKFLVDNCHPESGLLFPDTKDPFKRMCYRVDWALALEMAGITNYRFHDNRHTCGSYLAMSGHTLTEIAELLNHKTLEMAKRYSHLADEYREKLSARMNENFIAGAIETLGSVSGIDHPAVSQANMAGDTSKISDKSHLRRVK